MRLSAQLMDLSHRFPIRLRLKNLSSLYPLEFQTSQSELTGGMNRRGIRPSPVIRPQSIAWLALTSPTFHLIQLYRFFLDPTFFHTLWWIPQYVTILLKKNTKIGNANESFFINSISRTYLHKKVVLRIEEIQLSAHLQF